VRWLALYLRSRQVAAGAGIALAVVAGLGLLADEPLELLLAVLAMTAVVAMTAAGLAGPDTALERTAALDWRWRRAAHVVAIGGLTVALGAVAGPPVATEVLVRNAIGLSGATALGATVLGGGLAWCVPMAWMVAGLGGYVADQPPTAPAVTWLFQPPDTTAATVAAVVLGLAGLLVYSVRGPRAQ
jgi:hypothetical protein